MSVTVALLLGVVLGVVFSSFWFLFGRVQQLKAEHQAEISRLILEHETALTSARKKSVNTSRAVLKGKMAEQFAPLFPEFDYLPSDAKFLGDPVDYVVFSGYSEYREGGCNAEDIEIGRLWQGTKRFKDLNAVKPHARLWHSLDGIFHSWQDDVL